MSAPLFARALACILVLGLASGAAAQMPQDGDAAPFGPPVMGNHVFYHLMLNQFEGRFGDDRITDWTDNVNGTDGEDIVLVNYAGHTPLIADDGHGNAVITIDDGSVASSVTVEGILASQLHVINSGLDIIIH